MNAKTNQKPKTVYDTPTRRTIETLLRELKERTRGGFKEDLDYDRCRDEEDQVRARLLDVPEMREAERRTERAYSVFAARRDQLVSRFNEVRDRYLLEGITPEVIEDIRQLSRELAN